MTRDIVTNLPEVLQTGITQSDVDYEYSSSQDVYKIQKGPALRVFGITSGSTTFLEGADYDLIEDSDGNIKSIDWGVGGNTPNDGDLFTVDQEYESILSRYAEAHDEELNTYSDDLQNIISIRQIDSASDEELDRLGAIYGQLGRRQNRDDIDYRAFLKSIVSSFEGRGSRSGLKFAIAAAVNGSVDDVTIIEDVENLSYTIQVENVQGGVISGVIDDLAELADPSGVELDAAVILTEGDEIVISGSSSTTTTDTGLGGNTLTLDGNSTLG